MALLFLMLFSGLVWLTQGDTALAPLWVIPLGVLALALAWVAAASLVETAQARSVARAGGPESSALHRIRAIAVAEPGCRFRVYRTPAGLRVIALHRRFEPGEPDVARYFQQLGTDPLYRTLCLTQRCFRARLTPKPWRIEMPHGLRPSHGSWPVPDTMRAVREQWVREYELKSRGYAACEFIETIGSGNVDAIAEKVCRLHDTLSGAEDRLPIA
ncbi:hypothetical protein [Tahibacter amnicola]|uniref:Uncharacterized protein n=1 Tax=Tahibacter amnicola TaxID=2976241 RepID=A0ABY6BGM9_9GAMM|nr:hypothetical protein [Tahibacter amnicola]UXI69186.1 hypothetical protein N4264_05930 [Tahibacter amnicola]